MDVVQTMLFSVKWKPKTLISKPSQREGTQRTRARKFRTWFQTLCTETLGLMVPVGAFAEGMRSGDEVSQSSGVFPLG